MIPFLIYFQLGVPFPLVALDKIVMNLGKKKPRLILLQEASYLWMMVNKFPVLKAYPTPESTQKLLSQSRMILVLQKAICDFIKSW